MIPFPGESVSLDSFTNLVGTPVASLSDIQVRAGASFFGSGDTVEVRTQFFTNYLDGDTEDIVASWVVEVVGGTASLHLTEGLDAATVDLGTYAISGATTLVVPSSTITVADVWAQAQEGVLQVEVSGGSLMVQQVKLRVWPAAGPLGGWGDTLHPSWERNSTAALEKVVRQDLRGVDDGWGAPYPTASGQGWENTLALMPDVIEGGTDTVPIAVGLGGTITEVGGQCSVDLHGESGDTPPPGSSGGSVIVDGEGVIVRRDPGAPDINPAEGLVDGVDYIANPSEVWGDRGAFASADTDPTASWVVEYDVGGVTRTLGELMVAEYYPDNDAPPVFPLVGALPWAPVDVVEGGGRNLWPDNAAGPPGDLTLPDADAVLVGPSHGWFRDSCPTIPSSVTSTYVWHGDYVNGFTWRLAVPLEYTAHMPTYRVWDVTAIKRRPLRQLHRDDGQGGTPPRAFGGASRIRTGRAYGYD